MKTIKRVIPSHIYHIEFWTKEGGVQQETMFLTFSTEKPNVLEREAKKTLSKYPGAKVLSVSYVDKLEHVYELPVDLFIQAAKNYAATKGGNE